MRKGSKKQSKITLSQKKEWLKKNNIPIRKELKQGTINRLYSFYHRNPLTTPYFLAYGMKKRAFKYIEKTGETYTIQTPKGRVNAKTYIHKIDRETKKEVSKKIPFIVTPDFNHYYPTVKHLRDEFFYVIRPPLKCNILNFEKCLWRLHDEIVPEIIKTIQIFKHCRGFFYKNYDVGALCHFTSENISTETGIDDPTFYIRVPWIDINDLNFFKRQLYEHIRKGLEIVYNYDKGIIILFRIDIYISVKWKASNVDLLRLE